MLRLRIISAILGIPLLLGVTYLGGWPLAAVTSFLSLIGADELVRMTRPNRSVVWIVRAWAAVLPPLALVRPLGPPTAFLAVLFLFPAFVTVVAMRGRDEEAVVRAGRQVPPVFLYLFYPTLALSLLVVMSAAAPAGEGFRLIWAVLFTVWTGDTAAYFAGRLMGGPRLAPVLSPGKTVSGAVAALAVTTVLGLALLPGFLSVSLLTGGVFGLAVGLAAQVGDLFESLLKREAGVKDSGGLIPGHGGILDRFDSLAFALPMAYLIFLARGLI